MDVDLIFKKNVTSEKTACIVTKNEKNLRWMLKIIKITSLHTDKILCYKTNKENQQCAKKGTQCSNDITKFIFLNIY